MPILGLVSTESLTRDTFWEANYRRKVFHQYPNGAMSIIGLLSLMKVEEVNSPEFYWWEERFKRQKTVTKTQGSSKGPFRLAADAVDGLDPFLPVIDTEFVLYVDSNTLIRVGHVIMIQGLTGNSATGVTMRCVVTESGTVNGSATTTKVKCRPISIPAAVAGVGFDNGATNENVSATVWVIGSAFAQGMVNTSGEVYYLPDKFTNYTQIFRTPFSFTRNALQVPTKFDETGQYREKAKQHSLYHMVEMERAFMFGERAIYVKGGSPVTAPPDPTNGTGLPEYKTGGILGWFLPQWEAADATYRGGTGAPAVTLDSDDDKRIIQNSLGTINEATWDTYLERVFRKTNNVTNERLCVCGSGALKTVNQMYRQLGTLPYKVPGQDAFGMRIVSHECPFGTIYYKTHPLFSEDYVSSTSASDGLWASMLFMDVHNLRYRPFVKADTFLRKGIQTPSMDGRVDEWMTEAGLEMKFPETFLFHKNILNYVP